MTSQSGPLLALTRARDEMVAAVAALSDAAIAARVPWTAGDLPLAWLVLMRGAHEVEHRIDIERLLAALGWGRSRAIGHLADAAASRRRIEALLVGVPEEAFDREPAPGEWSPRQMIEHVIATDRRYWLQTRHAADRADDDPLRPRDDLLPDRVPPAVRGEPPAALVARLRETHHAALDALVDLSDAQLQRPTDWAGSPQSVAFRLHRFSAHYDEHAADLDTTLSALGVARSTAVRIAGARAAQLGALESLLLGVPAELLDRRPASADTGRPSDAWSLRDHLEHLVADDRGLLDRVRGVASSAG